MRICNHLVIKYSACSFFILHIKAILLCKGSINNILVPQFLCVYVDLASILGVVIFSKLQYSIAV